MITAVADQLGEIMLSVDRLSAWAFRFVAVGVVVARGLVSQCLVRLRIARVMRSGAEDAEEVVDAVPATWRMS